MIIEQIGHCYSISKPIANSSTDVSLNSEYNFKQTILSDILDGHIICGRIDLDILVGILKWLQILCVVKFCKED